MAGRGVGGTCSSSFMSVRSYTKQRGLDAIRDYVALGSVVRHHMMAERMCKSELLAPHLP